MGSKYYIFCLKQFFYDYYFVYLCLHVKVLIKIMADIGDAHKKGRADGQQFRADSACHTGDVRQRGVPKRRWNKIKNKNHV